MSIDTKNAIITNATLTADDHGLLSAWVTLDYGGHGQGFGGHVLYLPKDCKRHELKSFAGHFIWRVMEVAGVTEWEKLKGKTVRVRASFANVEAIGHIVKDDWFCPRIDFGRDEVAMKLLRYDSIRNICLVCQRIGNVYRLIEMSANDLTIGQLRGEG